MNTSKNLLKKYAELIVKTGANVQKGQMVVVNSLVEYYEFTHLIVEEAYKVGAGKVIVNYLDNTLKRIDYENVEKDILKEVPDWFVERYKYWVENKCCFIHITSTVPDLLSHIDADKLQAVEFELRKAVQPFRYYTMANHGQWTIAAVPNPVWAKKVFPHLNEEEGMKAFWDVIFKIVHISEDNNPIDIWKKHNENLKHYYTLLNNLNLKALHFTNSIGTDLIVELAINHLWRGGQDFTLSNVPFNPNMPTEEVFTMPKRDGVNGIVYATKPLNYQDKLIDKFWIRFENGKAVEFKAEQNEEILRNLIETDEGSCYLGEVALISFDTPISQSDLLFYNTLYDENASCHLALGAAYPTNMKNGENMTSEELLAHGCNVSITHNDFMFGSSDMNIKGITFDGKEISIFENGKFVI